MALEGSADAEITIVVCIVMLVVAIGTFIYFAITHFDIQRKAKAANKRFRSKPSKGDDEEDASAEFESFRPNKAGAQSPSSGPPPVAPRQAPPPMPQAVSVVRDPSKLRQSKWLKLEDIRKTITDLAAVEELFKSVPVNDVPEAKLDLFVDEKNRYTNILPNPHSQVRLSAPEDRPGDAYINANWMDGFEHEREYILTQGPLGNTIGDFWRMVWENDSRVIVMITKLAENGRVKCEKYWADREEKYRIGNLILVWTASEVHPHFKVTTMKLGNAETKETRTIKHFWFDSWPDHGVPDTTESVTDFVLASQTARKAAADEAGKEIPTVVHCSAGIGRTGVFVAVDVAVQQVEAYRKFDPAGILCHMRRARGGCVQTATQFLFFLLVIRDYLIRMGMFEKHLETANEK